MVSDRDLKDSLRILVGSILAWLLPERYWYALMRPLAAREVRSATDRTRKRARWLEQSFGNRLDAARRREIVIESTANTERRHLYRLRELSPLGWHPSIEVRGEIHVSSALADGHGAILWVSDSSFSSIPTKKGLHRCGLWLHHLSRPGHAFVGSRYAKRVLTPIWLRAENRYLAERIIFTMARSVAVGRRLRKLLKNNSIISITVGATAIKTVAVPFLDSRLSLAAAPAKLALESKARLLPVFTVRNDAGGFEVEIEPPLSVPAEGGRQAQVDGMIREYARRLEPWALKYPDQFLAGLKSEA
jgi:lauroyl/myristoyl acyltransferase